MPKATKTNTTQAASAPGDNLAAVIARMNAIAAKSGDSLFLADGPPHPDFALLDLCGDALHFATAAEQAYEARFDRAFVLSVNWNDESHRKDDALMAEYTRNNNEVTKRLRRATKMKAKTPAGIYAKALLVRYSKTGATALAMSLATDLVECPGLRESLWPAEQHA